MMPDKESHFKVVALMGKVGSDLVKNTIEQLVTWLEARDVKVILEADTAAFIINLNLQVKSIEVIGGICDLVIVVGGDGCLLGAGRALAKHEVPILGVNRGRLGFLADVLPSELEHRMEEVFKGDYQVENRFLLNASLENQGKLIFSADAVNDVVLHPGQAVQMIEFELYIEGNFVFRQRSDGLIIATPTGSTAYALSAGGPMVHSTLEAITLVPICPHTLSNRPIVVHAASEIKVTFCDVQGTTPLVSCDGQSSIEFSPGDVLYVRRKSQPMRLLHPLDYDFYAACRSKLGWASKLIQEPE